MRRVRPQSLCQLDLAGGPSKSRLALAEELDRASRSQRSGPMKTGEYRRVTPIWLPPIARLGRNQRPRHHVAAMAEAWELAMNAIEHVLRRTVRPHNKRQRLAGTPKRVE